jgi:DNA-binding HxlR family transcriptional regulator
MPRGYGQYCPLALAVELLCERWTLLIVSRLIDGCAQFSDIQRGLPRISPSLLSQRLDQLERSGVVRRRPARSGYALTPAGRDLEAIVDKLAVWGQLWGRDMVDDDLDPAFLVWSMHTRLDAARMPPGRTLVEIELCAATGDPHRFWLLSRDGAAEMCLKHPGYPVDLHVAADLRLFVEAWRGIRDLRREIQARRIRLVGPPALRRQFPDWLKLSALAPFPRRRPGRELRLTRARVLP